MNGHEGLSQLVVFGVADRRYALPLEQVVEVLRLVAVTPVPEAPPWVSGVVNLRGRLVPMVDLRPRMGLAPAEPDPAAVFLVAATARRTVAVLADSVGDVVTVPAGAIERPDDATAADGLVSAVTRSPDGVVLMVNLDRLAPSPELMLTADG